MLPTNHALVVLQQALAALDLEPFGLRHPWTRGQYEVRANTRVILRREIDALLAQQAAERSAQPRLDQHAEPLSLVDLPSALDLSGVPRG